MSGEQSAPTGPDFEQGVLASEVLEGKPLLGHVQDQAAILTRSNGKLYAVGATCTHYSGPLAEGLVVDGTIRCPWHHAAFDLATGACTRPPALGAIPCWNVEERGGRAVVPAMLRYWPRGFLGGAMQAVSYGTVLWAMTLAPIAVVATLRETSVLFGALIAVVILKEPLRAVRIVAALLILAGLVLIRLQ